MLEVKLISEIMNIFYNFDKAYVTGACISLGKYLVFLMSSCLKYKSPTVLIMPSIKYWFNFTICLIDSQDLDFPVAN